MNAASRMALDIARQDLADKMARAECNAQRREARAIQKQRTNSGRWRQRVWQGLRLSAETSE